MSNKLSVAMSQIPDPTALIGNELSKSRHTRRRILDAACEILATQGYPKFSTAGVAARAKLTRPAMLYHFGSRLELLTATIQHIARRRLEMLEESLASVMVQQGSAAITGADLYWEQLQTTEYLAFSELVCASRTNEELASILSPALEAYDLSAQATAAQLHASTQFESGHENLLQDISRFLAEAVAHNPTIQTQRDQRVDAMRKFLNLLATTDEGAKLLQAASAQSNGETAVEDIEAPMPTKIDLALTI